MSQVVQIAGSLLVLAAFALAQAGVLDPKSQTYLAWNAAGATVLAVEAVAEQQWGFLLLEGVWAVVSAVSLADVLRGRARAGRHGAAVNRALPRPRNRRERLR